MEEWQNGHDQPGYHYHQEQDKKRKPIETPGKRFWKMWGPLLIKWGIGIGVGMVVMAAMMVASLLTGCGVAIKYSLSGASIPPDARTFSVAYFPNNATMVAPILSSTLTDALVDVFTRRTRLMQVEEGGDFAFEGEIINYTSTTASVSSDDYALLNRLTITIKVRFTNALDEKQSWNRTFTAYEDYESTRLLTEVEGELIPQIVDKLVTDIFQASASNW